MSSAITDIQVVNNDLAAATCVEDRRDSLDMEDETYFPISV
jgi:hypothetical protein